MQVLEEFCIALQTYTDTTAMPLILTALALLIINNANAEDSIQEEETVVLTRNAVNDALSQLRHIILNGDPDRGIPVLDPLQVEELPLPEGALPVEGSLSDVRVEGLGAFVVEKSTTALVSFLPPLTRVTVVIRLPAISATGGFGPRATPPDARGNFTVVVKDITFTLKVVVTVFYNIRSVDVSLGMGDIFIDVQGAGEVGNFLNNEAAHRIQTWFAENRSQLEQQLAPIIKETLQSFQNKKTQTRAPGTDSLL